MQRSLRSTHMINAVHATASSTAGTPNIPLRELVIEDNEMLFTGVQAMLRTAIADHFELLRAANIVEALECIGDFPALILIDPQSVDATDRDLLSEMRQLAELTHGTPMMIIAGDPSPRVIREAFKAGIAGYITRTTTVEVGVTAIELVLNGGYYVPPQAMSMSAEEVSAPRTFETATRLIAGESDAELTTRQRDILAQILEGRSNKEIARTLDLSVGTVKNYVSKLLRVAKVKSRSQMQAAMMNVKSGDFYLHSTSAAATSTSGSASAALPITRLVSFSKMIDV